MTKSLIGKTVRICPNDFTPEGCLAVIEAISEVDQKILLKFSPALAIAGKSYTGAVASFRDRGVDSGIFMRSGSAGFSIIWIPDNLAEQQNPADTSWWRGGGAAVADVIIS